MTLYGYARVSVREPEDKNLDLQVERLVRAGCSQALPLIEGIAAEHLLADKAYDTNEIIDTATERGMNPVIPPKSNWREKREYDRALYKLRHLVENGFLDFKQWRGVATRYAKNSLSYLGLPDSGDGDLD